MKKQYTKKQIQEAISYWQKQLKTMNESEFGQFKHYFSTIDIDIDIPDEDIDNWYDDFCKAFSKEDLEVEKYMFDIAVNRLSNISDKNDLLNLLAACRGYLSVKETLIKWQKRFRELCNKHKIFNGPTADHARKNGNVIYGISR